MTHLVSSAFLAADLERIISYGGQPHIKRATVVGGGLLGLEAAKAVYDMHEIEDVSIINRTGYPLSRQLDSSAGEMVLRRIEAMGVKVSPIHSSSGPERSPLVGSVLIAICLSVLRALLSATRT